MPNPNFQVFLMQKWAPFLNELDKITEETARRTQLGYDLAHRLPTQSTIIDLTDKCRNLTAEYYGADKSNISVMYAFLIRISVAAGITFYDPIPTSPSKDHYLELIDLNKQQSASNIYLTSVRNEYIKHGGRIVRGRSAIDNTISPNIFLQEDARKILARQGMMKAIIKFLHLVKNRPDLCKLENAGQLSQLGKERLWQVICDAIPEQPHKNDFKDLVDFIHKNPGEYFENNPKKHRDLLFSGLANGELKAVARATMVRTTPHRFIKHSYIRQIPLQTVINGQLVTLRTAGIEETIYLRANEGHYLREHHGLSLAAGNYTRLFNLFFPSDPAAFTRNNRYPDIEWMVAEALAYNSDCALPKEQMVMVGRNSYTGSSIKQTAHGQTVCAFLDKFPHYAASNNPQKIRNFNAVIDILPIGTTPDASCLKLITEDLRQKNLLEFVSGLITAMQLHFGEDKIDFQMQIIPSSNGFVLILIPFAMLQQNGNIFTNPTTGVTNTSVGVPEHLHMGHAAGRWAATPEQARLWEQNGHTYLQKLYDYAALAGTRDFMHGFIRSAVCSELTHPAPIF